jgi:hypothetical protein
MKRILMREMPDPRFQQGEPGYKENFLHYRDMIEQAIRVPLNREKGADIDEMRKGIRVLDAVDRSKDNVLELEDADWEHLRDKVKVVPWAMIDRRFVEFYDDIMGATDAVHASRTNGVAST